jgi:hypothetical protein
MFWGAVVKEGQALKSTKIFESMEYPALHLSQAVLVKGNSARLSVSMGKNSEPIVIAVLSEKMPQAAITCYVNMTQTLALSVVGKGAEVHICGHYEAEGHQPEDDMFYGDEEEEDEEEEDDAGKKNLSANLKQAEANKNKNAETEKVKKIESVRKVLVPDDDSDDDDDEEDEEIDSKNLDLDDEEEEDEDEEDSDEPAPKGKDAVFAKSNASAKK